MYSRVPAWRICRLVGDFFAFPPIKLILYSHGNRLGSNPGKNRDLRRGVSCVVGVPGRRPVLIGEG